MPGFLLFTVRRCSGLVCSLSASESESTHGFVMDDMQQCSAMTNTGGLSGLTQWQGPTSDFGTT